MKRYNIFLTILGLIFMASCAENDLPQPEIQTFQMTGTINTLDEFGEAITGEDLSDVSITLIRQGFETIIGSASASTDGTYSIADLPIREYGILIEKDGFNQALGSNDFMVSSSASTEQRMIVNIPENVSGNDYTQNLYLRQMSSTMVDNSAANRASNGSSTDPQIVTTISGNIVDGTANTGFKRGVYAYFSTTTPTNEEDGFSYAVLIPLEEGNTSFSFEVTDATLLNNGFQTGNTVNVAFYGVTLNASNELVTIANSTPLVENALFQINALPSGG